MKLKCPYCGSHRTETVGGPDGNPFNGKRQEKTVCLDCGRTMPSLSGLCDVNTVRSHMHPDTNKTKGE